MHLTVPRCILPRSLEQATYHRRHRLQGVRSPSTLFRCRDFHRAAGVMPTSSIAVAAILSANSANSSGSLSLNSVSGPMLARRTGSLAPRIRVQYLDRGSRSLPPSPWLGRGMGYPKHVYSAAYPGSGELQRRCGPVFGRLGDFSYESGKAVNDSGICRPRHSSGNNKINLIVLFDSNCYFVTADRAVVHSL